MMNNEERRNEFGRLLPDERMSDALISGTAVSTTSIKIVGPIELSDHLHVLSLGLSLLMQPPNMGTVLYRQLHTQISQFFNAFGALDRIKTTPIPFVYVVHLRTILILYLFGWNAMMVLINGWVAAIPALVVAWALLGIEAASVECECPFHFETNHLALGKTCIEVSHNVAQTIHPLFDPTLQPAL